jgi:hypothetical protein
MQGEKLLTVEIHNSNKSLSNGLDNKHFIGCSVNNDDNCFMSSDSKGNLAKDEFVANHSESFSGLGNLGKPVSFVLDPKVHPVHAPMHTPDPCRQT